MEVNPPQLKKLYSKEISGRKNIMHLWKNMSSAWRRNKSNKRNKHLITKEVSPLKRSSLIEVVSKTL
jgi:hypothetical protein